MKGKEESFIKLLQNSEAQKPARQGYEASLKKDTFCTVSSQNA